MTTTARFSCFIALQILLCLACLVPLRGALAADGSLTSYSLSNGLKIYVVEKHSAPVASVQVWYRTGSLNERSGIRGLSHLFEHMMFRGSEHFGPEEHHRRIAQHGGTNNAYTREDVTVYLQTVPAQAVDLVMEMEADRMARLKLDESILRTEVEVVKEEYRLTIENDPFMRILSHLAREYFGDHPYSYMVLGDMNDLDTVSVATCLDYYHERYAPNNATLIVAGDVAPDEVLAAAERHFGPIAAAERIAPDPPPPVLPGRRFSGKEDLPVPITAIAYRLPPAGDPDIPALEILIRLLSTRLERRLTRESSLCVYFDNTPVIYRQASVVLFMGAHLPSVPSARVRDAIDAEIARFLGQPFPLEELDRTRNQRLLEEANARMRAESIAEEVGNAVLYGGDLERYTKRLEHLAALTPAGLLEVGRRYLTADNRVEVFLEPKHPSLLLKVAGWFKTTLHV